MNIRHNIFPILFATTISAFASSSSTIQEREAETKTSASTSVTSEKKPVQLVVLEHKITSESTTIIRKEYIPYKHNLIEKVTMTMNLAMENDRLKDYRSGNIFVKFKNYDHQEVKRYIDPYQQFMQQTGSFKTDTNSPTWTIDHNNIYESEVSYILKSFIACLFQYEPTTPPDFGFNFFKGKETSPLAGAFKFYYKDFAKETRLSGKLDRIYWAHGGTKRPRHEFIPIGSKTIFKAYGEHHALARDLTNLQEEHYMFSLTTYEPFEKIQNGHYGQKCANAFALLNLWGNVDIKDPCTFHFPAGFITTEKNLELFSRILDTLEPDLGERFQCFFGHGQIKEPPYDISF